ncbi:MAG: hypothetical protein GW893_05360 [Armatimonadetes bacterium]|nr:hypothetical protein [Armatimonadota bacterium]
MGETRAREVLEALKAAAARGVKVLVILNYSRFERDVCAENYDTAQELAVANRGWDFKGYESNGVTHTLSLDRMAKSGAIFRAAHWTAQPPRLFDLQTDRHELCDLSPCPADRDLLHRRMSELLARTNPKNSASARAGCEGMS